MQQGARGGKKERKERGGKRGKRKRKRKEDVWTISPNPVRKSVWYRSLSFYWDGLWSSGEFFVFLDYHVPGPLSKSLNTENNSLNKMAFGAFGAIGRNLIWLKIVQSSVIMYINVRDIPNLFRRAAELVVWCGEWVLWDPIQCPGCVAL